MTYEEAAEFADSTKKYGSILGLESIRNLMQELGNIQEQLHIIHVAGTNGKGSVCAFLSAALTEAGYRVGRYNSPAVFERREVFRIGETMISKEEYAAVFERVQTACEVLTKRGCPHPTVFEVETAAAFLWFYEKKCDLVLLETGMGGETDATNLITHPVCSVLTSIGMDHMQYLGNTIEEIAKVKAGIIKKGCPVVALKQSDGVCEVIKNKAEECGSRCVLVEVPASVEENVMTEQGQRQGRCIQDRPIQKQCIQYPVQGTTLQDARYGSVHTALGGVWQRENLSLALAVLKLLEESDYSITKEAVQSGIAKTIWHGRYEVLQTEPLFIIDGAHNPIAAKRLKQTIEKDFTNREIIYIIGVLADKEHEKMLRLLLPGAKAVFTVTPDSPRALDGESLAKEAQKYADNIWYVPDIGKAVKMAQETAKESDVILAVGSLSYLKEVKKALGQG